MEALDLREAEGGLTLRVRVQPRASHAAIAGVRDGALVVRVTAPPAEGEANAALARLLGKALGLPPSCFRLLRGARGREKLLLVAGAAARTVRARLGAAMEKRK